MLRRRPKALGESILPLTTYDPGNQYSSTRHKRRRRKRRHHVALACCLYCLLSWLIMWAFVYTPLHAGIRPPYHHKILQIWSQHKKRLRKKLAVKIECPDGRQGLKDDDYCDCADGSDEPNTAACSHILVNKASFQCRDGKQAIHSSKVLDGVIDCSDRSDERRGYVNHFLVK